MSKSKNYGVIVHRDDFEDFLVNMNDQEAGAILKNMLNTFLGEDAKVTAFGERYMDSTSKKLCARVIYDKEKSEQNSANGAKGGGQIGNSNAKRAKNERKTSEGRAKTNLNINNNNNINIKDNKRPYGECANVLLSDDEYKKIVDQGLTNLIDELSFYIASKGDKYKSHYAVIRQWANRREKEKGATIIKPNQFTQGVQKRDIDFSDLEKKLIKN